MPSAFSSHSVFTKTSDRQNAHELLEDSPEFKRAKFWFWPIVIIITIFFWIFCRNSGCVYWFFLRARWRGVSSP